MVVSLTYIYIYMLHYPQSEILSENGSCEICLRHVWMMFSRARFSDTTNVSDTHREPIVLSQTHRAEA
jgi:hypothetical protein